MAALVMPELKTVGGLVAWARQSLAQAGIGNGAQEAMWLLEHAIGLRSHQLVSQTDREVSPEARAAVESLVARRVAREPLQYLLGTQEFCGLEFAVSPAVLIPRPETELLLRHAVASAQAVSDATIVDVGTGSGCVAITLATSLKGRRIIAVDRSPEALAVAQRNARRHGVSDRIEWLEGDLLAPLSERMAARSVNVIVSNPPYISEADWAGLEPEVRVFEPRMALIGGKQGTEFHERLLRESRAFLVPGGLLAMEIGAGQAAAVRRLAEQIGGYTALETIEDTAGIERVVMARRLK